MQKKEIKGLWGDRGRPSISLGPGPALVLQLTLPWPYNTPNIALYILAIFLHSMQQKWDEGTQYIKGHVGCIVVPWQGPLKDKCGSWTQ